MAEDKKKQSDELNEEQLDEVNGGVDRVDELKGMQFAMGQYNAKLESLSSVTKSLQDMLKSIAERNSK